MVISHKITIDKIVVTEPGEWRVLEMIQGWQKAFGIPVEIRNDDRFLCSLDEFEQWAEGRKSLRMEYFYRVMRRKTGWLMDGDKPVGGKWNYDIQNRKSLPKDVVCPERLRFKPDISSRLQYGRSESCPSDAFSILPRSLPSRMTFTSPLS